MLSKCIRYRPTTWTATARSETLWAQVPREGASTADSGVSGRRPFTEADVEVTSSAFQFETAAGLESDVAPDAGPVRDFGEQTLPYAFDGILKAHAEWVLKSCVQRI